MPEIRSLLSRLEKNDEMAKKLIICFIEHRLNHRYIRPLLNIPTDYKSGFLMMATSCLLIEALQSFYEGKNESTDDNEDLNEKRKGSERAFIKFFKNNEEFFPDFRDCFPMRPVVNGKGETIEKCTFFKHIRCGILHQAETTGGYRILRDCSQLFNKDKNTINANRFVKAMKCCLDKYIKGLRESETDTAPWPMAMKKIGHICDNCKSVTP